MYGHSALKEVRWRAYNFAFQLFGQMWCWPIVARITWGYILEERRKEMILQDHFTERELKEIEFCRLYVAEFNHGTSGHNLRIIVSKMADLLEQHYSEKKGEVQ